MISVASTSLSRVRTTPNTTGRAVEEAIQTFKHALKSNGLGSELGEFEKEDKIPPLDAVLTFTAQLDSANASRRGRSIATRLHPVLESVRQYTTIVDTFVSSDPKIPALIWGSIKTTLKFVSNYISYFEPFTALFIKIKAYCPVFNEYKALYPTSIELQKALCSFHASIIRCCTHVVQVIQQSGIQKLWQAFRSFEEEFDGDRQEIQGQGDIVRAQIHLAKAKADHQYQQMQAEEQKLLTRKLGKLGFSSRSQNARLEEIRLQQAKRESESQIQKLLKNLSSFDHFAPFREACKRRCPATTEWLFSTCEFIRWNTSSNVISVIGKIGSGKMITSASSIQHILANKAEKDFVTYHFFQYGNTRSLKVESMIRSVIRQSLKLVKLSPDIIDGLKKLDDENFSSQGDLIAFLGQLIGLSERFYIFLDGVDECELAQQHMLFDILLSLVHSHISEIRIFISGREALAAELSKRFPSLEQLSMASSEAKSDLGLYVENMILERCEKGMLATGDQTLLDEIQHVLIEHADGMFLWVTFLLDDLCAQYCDDDIRKCLKTLPKNLKDTFNRVLSRIVAQNRDGLVKKVIPWLAVAARPLTLGELCDALSIEFMLTKRTTPSSLPIIRFFSLSRKAVQMQRFTDFHVRLEEADHLAGDRCMTYLHYGDFQKAVARRQKPRLLQPMSIGLVAIGIHGKPLKLAKLVMDRNSGDPTNDCKYNLSTPQSYQKISTETPMAALQASYPFLKYAVENWHFHTTLFDEGRSSTWNLLQGIITEGHDLAAEPWSEGHDLIIDPFSEDDSTQIQFQIGVWALCHQHYALVAMVLKELVTRVLRGERWAVHNILERIAIPACEGNAKMLSIVLDVLLGAAQEHEVFRDIPSRLLVAASKNGRVEVVSRLIAAMADINAVRDNSPPALQVAAQDRRLDIVENLANFQVDINAAPPADGYTALQAASLNGHLEVVKLLVAHKARINASAAIHRYTALQAASLNGHLEIVKFLVAQNARIEDCYVIGGKTALEYARDGGHIPVVEFLTNASLKVDAGS